MIRGTGINKPSIGGASSKCTVYISSLEMNFMPWFIHWFYLRIPVDAVVLLVCLRAGALSWPFLE